MDPLRARPPSCSLEALTSFVPTRSSATPAGSCGNEIAHMEPTSSTTPVTANIGLMAEGPCSRSMWPLTNCASIEDRRPTALCRIEEEEGKNSV